MFPVPLPFGLAPSADGTKLVVTGEIQDGSELEFVTVAFRASTGERRWAQWYAGSSGDLAGARAIGLNAKSTKVYVAGPRMQPTDPNYPDFVTVAYDLATGDRLWAKRYKPGGYAQTLSVGGGKVYVGGDWTDGEGNGGGVVVAYAA